MHTAACISRSGLRLVSLLIGAVALVLGLVAVPVARAADTGASPAASTATGAVVTAAAHHDTSAPLRELAPEAVHDVPAEAAALPTDVNVEGLSAGESGGFVPPDTNSAVGLTQVVEVVNVALGVFTKRGARAFGPVPTNQLFAGFGGPCEATNEGDAVVRHDNLANRWVVIQFVHRAAPFGMCVAVSATEDATGAYHRYYYESPDSPDGPKLGVWPDAYYFTTNGFYQGLYAPACALDRAAMLDGLPATEQCLETNKVMGAMPIPADLDGTTPPPAGARNIVVGKNPDNDIEGLQAWTLHVDWANPLNSNLLGPIPLAVTPFSLLGQLVPQPGTTNGLAGSMFDFRLAYRNFGDHESLVFSHSMDVNGVSGIRWYELRLQPDRSPTVYQEGTYAPGDGVHRWMSSPAMDRFGNIAVGYSVSNATTVYPGIRYAGRLATDPLGELAQGETTVIDGGGAQTGTYRWGDYSSMSVDPVDDCTFWYSTEYIGENTAYSWRTRLASFRFPDCETSTPPPTVFSDDFEITRI